MRFKKITAGLLAAVMAVTSLGEAVFAAPTVPATDTPTDVVTDYAPDVQSDVTEGSAEHEAVYADAVDESDFDYVDLDDGTVEITGYTGDAAELEIPSTLGGKTVTSIGPWAFDYCDSLISITIPEGITLIYLNAFEDCDNLSSINVDPNNQSYASKDGVLFNKDLSQLLTFPLGKEGEYIIPDGVTFIEGSAFQDCQKLTSVEIPNGVTSIGYSAFQECSNLTSITIPDSVTSIGARAFYGCGSLTSINIPDSVTSIGEYTFYDCNGLKTLNIPKSVTSIGLRAFSYCSSLVSISLSENVTDLEFSAFSSCESLTSINVDTNNQAYMSKDGILFNKDMSVLITYPAGKEGEYIIPEGVISLEHYAFENCTGLTSIVIADTVTNIESSAFDGCLGLTAITIPNGVTSIGDYAFSYCENLSSVDILGKVTSIGGSAFSCCSSLTSVTLPEGVEYLGDWVFYDCEKLINVILPDSLECVYDNIFAGCRDLSDVCFLGTEEQWNKIYYCKDEYYDVPEFIVHFNYVIHDHVAGEPVTEVKQPTCAEDGYSYKSIPCSVCGVYISREYTRLPQLEEHTWGEPVVDEEPTCSPGYKRRICQVCGSKDYETEEEIPPIAEHTWSEWRITIEPTCASGEKERNCEVCGRYEWEEIDPVISEHTWGEWEITKEPTCDYGEKERYCEVCGRYEWEEIDPVISEHTWGEWEITKEPTCDYGEKERYCEVCGYIDSEYIEPVKEHTWGEPVVDVEPSCSPGYERRICQECGRKDYETEVEIPPIAEHTWSEWSVTIEPTCDDGEKERYCQVCYERDYEDIDPVEDHIPGDTEIVAQAPAGHGVEGYITEVLYCAVCGNEISRTITVIPAVEHTPSDPVIKNKVDPTCAEEGYYEEVIYCTECREEISRETVTVPATGKHTYVNKVVAPTYTAQGYTEHTCSVCGDSYKDTYTAKKTVPAVSGLKLKARSSSAVRLTWTKNTSADGYIIERKDGSSWKQIADITKNATIEYRVPDLKAGTKYDFRIKAYKKDGNSKLYSEYKTVSAMTSPSVITGLKVKSRTGDAVRLAWNKNTTADGYIIERKSGNTWVRVAKKTKNTVTECRIDGLKAGTAYTFRVKAYKMDGKKGIYGGTTTITAVTAPSPISGLKVKSRSNNALRLAWTKNTTADGYIVERKSGNTWARVAKKTKNTVTECRIDGLKAGTAYTFRVKAYKMDGKTGIYGGTTTITAMTSPSAVSGLKLKAAAKNAVRITWTKNTSADGYIIEMKSGSSWKRVAKISKNSTVEFRKDSLKSKTSYTFRIKAYKMDGKTGLYSGYKTITVKTK